MKDFRVELSTPPQGVYFPGMSVTGAILFQTDKPKEYKQVIVSLNGGARVHWSESHGSGNDRRTYHYSSREHYLSTSAVLWDKTRDANGGSLPAGIYRFNFSIPLTANTLPPSYTGTVGAITYTIEARIVNKALKQDKKAIANITLGSVVKIDSPDLAPPLSQEVRKTLCCLCCESGPIVMTASIPRRGFCISYDTIPVQVHVENSSNRRIDNVTVSLNKRVTYYAEGHHRFDNVSCCAFYLSPVEPNQTADLHPDPLTISTSVPPTQIACRILTITYTVIVSAKVSYAFNPTIQLPVTIGNVPIQGGIQGGGANIGAPLETPLEAPPVEGHYPSAWEPPPSYPSDRTNPSSVPMMPIGFVDPIKR